MQWIDQFQLFLFDFDGLLVNTEHLHHQAYIHALARHGLTLDWSFSQFCAKAHFNAVALKKALYAEFPDLTSDWDTFYCEKRQIYLELVRSGKVELMAGVEPLLKELERVDIRRCVVTHSPLEQIRLIRSLLPSLNSLPYWITREDYTRPKPHPEGYSLAIERYGEEGGRIIGFEDSLRGLEALRKTPALPILICSDEYPLLEEARRDELLQFTSLDAVGGRL